MVICSPKGRVIWRQRCQLKGHATSYLQRQSSHKIGHAMFPLSFHSKRMPSHNHLEIGQFIRTARCTCCTDLINTLRRLQFDTQHIQNWWYLQEECFPVFDPKRRVEFVILGTIVVQHEFNLFSGVVFSKLVLWMDWPTQSIYQSINHISIASISRAKPGLVVRQPNRCPTAKLMKQFHNSNGPSGVLVSRGWKAK